MDFVSVVWFKYRSLLLVSESLNTYITNQVTLFFCHFTKHIYIMLYYTTAVTKSTQISPSAIPQVEDQVAQETNMRVLHVN